VSKRVSPTERIRADIDALFASERDLAPTLEDVARLSVRLMMRLRSRPRSTSSWAAAATSAEATMTGRVAATATSIGEYPSRNAPEDD
jgi:hypothetical protein